MSLGYYSQATSPVQSHTDWMSWVADSTRLNQMTIPGTHDSIAIHGGDDARTQSLCGDPGLGGCDLTQQLDAGIRFFDLRLSCHQSGSTYGLEAYHGVTDQNLSFDDEVQAFVGFLTSHPSEAVEILVTNAHAHSSGASVFDYSPSNCDSNAPGFFGLIGAEVASYPNFFYNPTTSPTALPDLGDIRGKIVVFHGNDLLSNMNSSGASTSSETDAPGFLVTGDHYNVCITSGCSLNKISDTDYGDHTFSMPVKRKEIANHFNDSQGLSTSSDQIRLNMIAGSGPGASVEPYTVAKGTVDFEGVNEAALRFLFGHPDIHQVGFVGMDFPGPTLIDALIIENLPHTKPLDPSQPYFSAETRDFSDAVAGLAQLAADDVQGEPSGYQLRSADIKLAGFVAPLLPPLDDAVFATWRKPASSAQFDCVSLCGTTRADGIGFGVTDLATATSGDSVFATLAADKAILQQALAGVHGDAAARVAHIHARLARLYPGTSFGVAAASHKGGDAHLFMPGDNVEDLVDDGWRYKLVSYNSFQPTMTLTSSEPHPVPGDRVTLTGTINYRLASGLSIVSSPVGWGCATPAVIVPGTITKFSCSITWPDLSFLSLTPRFAGGLGLFPDLGPQLDLVPGINITQQPADVTVAAGQGARLDVRYASEGEPSVQWYRSGDGGYTFNAYGAPTMVTGGSTLLIANQDTNTGAQYYAVITDRDTGVSVQTRTATVSINNIPYTPTLGCSPTNTTTGTPVTCTGTVKNISDPFDTPTGTMSFSVKPSGGLSATSCGLVGTALDTAACTVSLNATAGGSVQVDATYSGDGTHTGSPAAPVTVTFLDPTTTTVACNPSSVLVGTTTNCLVTVQDTSPVGASTPTGSVGAGGNLCALMAGAAAGSAQCTLPIDPPNTTPGSFTFTLDYSGDGSHATSSGGTTVTVVNPTTTTVQCNPNVFSPSAPSKVTTCTIAVTDTGTNGATAPSGPVTLSVSTTNGTPDATLSPTSCAATRAGKSESCSVQMTLTNSEATLTASFAGDAQHGASIGAMTVGPLNPTSTSVSCSDTVPPSDHFTCTATVTDTATSGNLAPTGSVSWSATPAGTDPTAPTGSFGQSTCASLSPSGTGATSTCQIQFTEDRSAPGVNVQANYGGDLNHQGSSGTGLAGQDGGF